MSSSLPFPLLDLGGSPFVQGRAHGEVLRADIVHNLAIYYRRLQDEGGLSRGEIDARVRAYAPVLESDSPDYWEGLRGMSEGSGISLPDLTLLNVRYELIYDRHSKGGNSGSDGCTAFALSRERTGSGQLLLGQNWDWVPEVRCALVRARDAEGVASGGEPLSILSFTEAGIFGGKIGFNSLGLGLAINGLNSTADDWARLKVPFHVRCYQVLRSASLEEALGVLSSGERSCSANFLMAQASSHGIEAGILNVESAPGAVCRGVEESGLLVHTNHFVEPGKLGVTEPAEELHPRTRERRARMVSLLESTDRVGVDDLRNFLRDHDGHPNSICRHSDPLEPSGERYATVASIVMDLDERVMWVCAGTPCRGEYRPIRLRPA